MRATYNTACVKFRKDNEAHIKAWCYINKCKEEGLSYADCIAELIDRLEHIAVKPQIISGDFRRLFQTETPVTVCGQ